MESSIFNKGSLFFPTKMLNFESIRLPNTYVFYGQPLMSNIKQDLKTKRLISLPWISSEKPNAQILFISRKCISKRIVDLCMYTLLYRVTHMKTKKLYDSMNCNFCLQTKKHHQQTPQKRPYLSLTSLFWLFG